MMPIFLRSVIASLLSRVMNLPVNFSALLCFAGILSITSCKPKTYTSDDKEASKASGGEVASKTGTFTVEGVTSTGKMSVQHFPATGEFSIICQNDEVGLMQLIFKDETDARTPQELQLIERVTSGLKEKKTADLSFQTFGIGANVSSRGGNPMSVTVTQSSDGNEVTFSGVTLFSVDRKSQRIVSGKLPY